MARGSSQIIRLSNFTGGEGSAFPVSAMSPKFSTRLQNCHISETGSVKKMPGYDKVNTTPVAETLTSGFEFRKTDGTTQILCAGGGKVYKSTGSTLTSIKTGLDTSAKVSFSAMNNICIMANGVDAPMKYDGTTVSALGGTPPATAFKSHVHKGRVWMLERANKMLASHSALNNPEDYTTAGNAGYIDFKFVLKEGDELLDIFTYIDLLVFVFRNHIAIYSGTNPTASGDFQLVQLIKGVGGAAENVTLNMGTDCAILSASGVKSLRQVVTTGSLNIDNISKNIEPTLQTEMANGISNGGMAHLPSKFWGMMLINDKVWLYSYLWKAWARMAGADVKGIFGTAGGKVYLCGTGYLYLYNQGWTFAGTSPEMIWETAWLSLTRSGNKAFPKMLEILAFPSAPISIDFSARYDLAYAMGENVRTFTVEPQGLTYIDTVTDWDAITIVDEVSISQYRLPLFGGGRIMQMSFKNVSDQPVEISDLVLQVVQGGF